MSDEIAVNFNAPKGVSPGDIAESVRRRTGATSYPPNDGLNADERALRNYLSEGPEVGDVERAKVVEEYHSFTPSRMSSVASAWVIEHRVMGAPPWQAFTQAVTGQREAEEERQRLERLLQDAKNSLRVTAKEGKGNFLLAYYDDSIDKMISTRVQVNNRFRHVSKIDTAVRDILG